VYTILRNADFTEGRGPMVATGVAFFDEKQAYHYIGSTQADPYNTNKNIVDVVTKGEALVKQCWYQVKEVQVFNSTTEAIEFNTEAAFKKIISSLNKEQLAILRKHKDKL
jgi:hypothetical protein